MIKALVYADLCNEKMYCLRSLKGVVCIVAFGNRVVRIDLCRWMGRFVCDMFLSFCQNLLSLLVMVEI